MAIGIKHGICASVALLVSFSVAGQGVAVPTFSPPMRNELRFPNYPEQLARRGIEGEVEIHLMVDTDGKPFEVSAVNSTGDTRFGMAAIRAVEDSSFIPAMVDGVPTIGSHRFVIRFLLEDSSGASRPFVKTYGDFLERRQSVSREELEELVAALEVQAHNRYERTYLNLARFFSAKMYGTPLEQMQHLDAALSFSRQYDDVVYLPEDEARNARRELFKLQVTNQYFRDAMETFSLIKELEDTEAVAMFQPVYEQIQALELNDTAIGIPVTLSDLGLFNLNLLKHNVYIEQLDGKVAEFRLSCERQYVGFPVEPEISYNLPAEWGVCWLAIIGDAGSTFTLVQH